MKIDFRMRASGPHVKIPSLLSRSFPSKQFRIFILILSLHLSPPHPYPHFLSVIHSFITHFLSTAGNGGRSGAPSGLDNGDDLRQRWRAVAGLAEDGGRGAASEGQRQVRPVMDGSGGKWVQSGSRRQRSGRERRRRPLPARDLETAPLSCPDPAIEALNLEAAAATWPGTVVGSGSATSGSGGAALHSPGGGRPRSLRSGAPPRPDLATTTTSCDAARVLTFYFFCNIYFSFLFFVFMCGCTTRRKKIGFLQTLLDRRARDPHAKTTFARTEKLYFYSDICIGAWNQAVFRKENTYDHSSEVMVLLSIYTGSF